MSAPVQLDLLSQLDYDPRHEAQRALMLRYLDGKPETYQDRYDFWCLTPGEACPGCGYVFRAGGHDSSGDHYMTPGRTECEGRIAYRKHAQHAATHGTPADLERAIRAASPCWAADDLRAEVTA